MKTIEELTAMKPSERIDFALEAFLEMEQARGWKPDMNLFHFEGEEACFACLGGAAAIKALVPEGFTMPFPAHSQRSFARIVGIDVYDLTEFEDSLDSARCGNIDMMFGLCKLPEDKRFRARLIKDYHEDRDGFFADMRQLSFDLKAAGY